MIDIIFTRTALSPHESYGALAAMGSSEPSLGLCYVAAAARQAGFKTAIIDAQAEGLDHEQLAHAIVDRRPKYVGISSVTISIHHAASLATLIKQYAKDTIVIVGGPHITAVPSETMERYSDFDIGVIGEGETAIVELLNALESHTPLGGVSGIIFRIGNELRITDKRGYISDLDTLPLPAWDLLPDLSCYVAPMWSRAKGPSGILITSRGCPGRCTYCDRTVFGNRCRMHSTESVLGLIRQLYEQRNVRYFRIFDDNFIMLKKRLVDICNAISRDFPDITWSCLARVDGVDPEILRLMKKAGCVQIRYGVETACQEIHDLEQKSITEDQIRNAITWTHQAGIKTVALCIIGHPLETPETIKSTMQLLTSLPVDDFKMTFMTPYPGTELYEHAAQYGSFEKDWSKMSHYAEPVFVPFGMTKKDLIRYRNRAFIRFYARPRIVRAYLRSLRSIARIKDVSTSFWSLLKWADRTR